MTDLPTILTDIARRSLGEHMSSISEEMYAAGWLDGTEWVLWRALLDWRKTGRAFWSPDVAFPQEITGFMPDLDVLQQGAGGWVWWLDTAPRGMVFVPQERWLRLAEAHHADPSRSNEELDREVPA